MKEELGTYVSINYDPRQSVLINKIYKTYNIPGLLKPEDFHTTIVYCDNKQETRKDIQPTLSGRYIQVVNPRYEFIGPDEECLVITFDSLILQQRHTELLATYNLFHGYPEYKSHITLSYKAKGFPIEVLLPFPFDYLKINQEKIESLDSDWSC